MRFRPTGTILLMLVLSVAAGGCSRAQSERGVAPVWRSLPVRQLLAAVFLLVLIPMELKAQELTPRAYWPAPQGTRVATVGMAYTDGDTVPDPSLPIVGFDSKITTTIVGYLQTIELFGRSANLVFDVPYSSGNTVAEHPELGSLERDYRGLGDIGATLSINLMGAPAMNREEFAELRANPRPILGASLKVVAPTGDYDSDRVINVGANRWAARMELGYIAPLAPRLLLELQAGIWFMGDNDDFLGLTREQEPIYAFQANLVKRFSPGFWLSLDGNYYRGGRSRLDGIRLNDLQRDSRIGVSMAFPVLKRNAVKFSVAHGSLNDSDESFVQYTMALQHLF